MFISRVKHKRYLRQLILPGFGEEGQEKLRQTGVLIVGCGGLGSAAALYLAAAGVGRLGLVDNDIVDETNLQRQVLHDTLSIDHPKVDSAEKRLSAINPEVEIKTYFSRLTRENVMSVLGEYDLAVECSDNLATKYLMNDACFFQGKTLCYGGIIQTDGQASTFMTQSGGPCYRCLFPLAAEKSSEEQPSASGVLGPVAGVIGNIQAAEAIKVIVGLGKNLKGRLLFCNLLTMDFEIFKYQKDKACLLCGNRPRIHP